MFWIGDSRARRALSSLYDLVKAVPRIYQGNLQDSVNEWRNLDIVSLPQKLEDTTICGPLDFCKILMNVQGTDGSNKFCVFAKFALNVLIPVTIKRICGKIIF